MTKKRNTVIILIGAMLTVLAAAGPALAWHDESHLAVARAAGYSKWYNAAGADMTKVKAGAVESHNHYVNNPRGLTVTPREVLSQAALYDRVDRNGHLYGAIVASLRNYIAQRSKGKYGEFHMAFCAHYIGDLSQPLHNTVYDRFNRSHHVAVDRTLEGEVLENIDKIRPYPVTISTESDLAREVARIANLSMALGYRMADEQRPLTREEAYGQLRHSASLLRAVLEYARKQSGP